MYCYPNIEQSDLPPCSQLRLSYGLADFADAFSVDLPERACHDAEALARHVFARQPAWIGMLLRFRDILVRPFGLKTAADLKQKGGDRISLFHVFERYDDEIVLGEDDTHLDFRLSVLVQPSSHGRSRLTVTTLVFYKRPLGRAYITLIAPFHRVVVRASLHRAQRLGWPNA
ncbi:DUF2867 domain-containing protein [Paraburkholderia sprentiae WSM5005]|uniref:DUF2867 domain-containing protein n=1 Tax=Paraburkholderia sprentiae WSM5005 TaxID=754502 RepID=A0A1I9YPK8_9BURK|nr:DUF2867 domain-containing protein [Paraburkholderia sprentiae]APA88241.1 DUF2867 domain-containing protein [Paraburkholderia sprentiae WSM5005]